ncbi:unnamed protein product [Brassica oleracea]
MDIDLGDLPYDLCRLPFSHYRRTYSPELHKTRCILGKDSPVSGSSLVQRISSSPDQTVQPCGSLIPKPTRFVEDRVWSCINQT